MTPFEQRYLRESLRYVRRDFTTHDWRFYFTHLLGRDVTLQETDSFLRAEADIQQRELTNV